MTNPDVTAARDLLAKAEPAIRNRSDRMLAQAQVHATLAVEGAVRDLIEKVGDIQAVDDAITGRDREQGLA